MGRACFHAKESVGERVFSVPPSTFAQLLAAHARRQPLTVGWGTPRLRAAAHERVLRLAPLRHLGVSALSADGPQG